MCRKYSADSTITENVPEQVVDSSIGMYGGGDSEGGTGTGTGMETSREVPSPLTSEEVHSFSFSKTPFEYKYFLLPLHTALQSAL